MLAKLEGGVNYASYKLGILRGVLTLSLPKKSSGVA